MQLIRIEQLERVGVSRRDAAKRAARGTLHRIHAGVYAIHPPPYSREQLWLAATYACGPGALLSDLPAAGHWGIVESAPLVAHVSVSSGRGRSREGIVVHRRAVDPRDVRRKDGIFCASVDRVLVDLASSHSEAQLETMLVAAESLGLLRRRRLAELVAERKGRPGAHKLATILELEPAMTRSELELLFIPIWREAGVDRPRVNHPIAVERGTLTVDFAWPELRMIVEADSQRFHGDWSRAEADRERDQLLAVERWVVHRFTRGQIKGDRAGAVTRLRRLAEVAKASAGGSTKRL